MHSFKRIYKDCDMWSPYSIIIIAVIAHLIILRGAFDIYFSSPIEHGMSPVKSTNKPPAKRLVLIVADGLRASSIGGEYLFERAPNLAKIILHRSSFGVSQTRVPTESRPGHVALLAGIYEDPSAILQGWKSNPVEFDSILNQSTNAFCWGSPDILTMFNKENQSKIHLDYYDENNIDFGQSETTVLDRWVFDRVEIFLRNFMKCEKCPEVRTEGNVFFLHLLGIDTAGHAYKPNSAKYIENIKFVDENLPRMEQLFETAFPDKGTAYIFTSDHGMTDWGSHGAGTNHETRTPIVAWGAGIDKKIIRRDINQTDVAPLAAALIGINYPSNSMGMLPTDYLNVEDSVKIDMLYNNMKQLKNIFDIKRLKTKANALRYVPYAESTDERVSLKLRLIRLAGKAEDYATFHMLTNRFRSFISQGIDYYHNYYQLPILISLTIGILSWIITLGVMNVKLPPLQRYEARSYKILYSMFLAISAIIIQITYIQNLPIMYYVYFLFPCLMVFFLVRRYYHIIHAIKLLKKFGLKYACGIAVMYACLLILIVKGFNDREYYSILLVIMSGWVYYSKSLNESLLKREKYSWIFACWVCAIFPLMPTMETKVNYYIYLSGLTLASYMARQIEYMYQVVPVQNKPYEETQNLSLQALFCYLTPIYTVFVYVEYIHPMSYFKYISWFLAICPVLVIPNTQTDITERLGSIFIGFLPFYFMITAHYEVLFLVTYIILLIVWLTNEVKSFGKQIFGRKFDDNYELPDRLTTSEDIRRAFFFMVFIFVGFFGTGNLASLNSFDPMWVRCFLTVYSPFKMTVLISVRVLIPFLYTTCVYRAMNVYRNGDISRMFCLVLMLSDIILLQMFYAITNTGSWLEIGMSLSHFIIMVAFTFILLLLYAIASFLSTVQYKWFQRFGFFQMKRPRSLPTPMVRSKRLFRRGAEFAETVQIEEDSESEDEFEDSVEETEPEAEV